jgi:hypothetical protein
MGGHRPIWRIGGKRLGPEEDAHNGRIRQSILKSCLVGGCLLLLVNACHDLCLPEIVEGVWTIAVANLCNKDGLCYLFWVSIQLRLHHVFPEGPDLIGGDMLRLLDEWYIFRDAN